MNDWTVPQNWAGYTPDEHALWDRLFARQSALLPGRAAAPFLQGLELLRLARPGIPDFDELSARLRRATGWSVVDRRRSLLTWTSDDGRSWHRHLVASMAEPSISTEPLPAAPTVTVAGHLVLVAAVVEGRWLLFASEDNQHWRGWQAPPPVRSIGRIERVGLAADRTTAVLLAEGAGGTELWRTSLAPARTSELGDRGGSLPVRGPSGVNEAQRPIQPMAHRRG